MSIIGNAIMVGGQAEFTSPQWKDVNFIDYDGTLLYSYTASEFQSLSEMPANVSRQGLVPEGWNWSLSDAQSQVANMGRCLIGQTCTLDTNMVRVDIKLEEGQLSPYLGLQGYYRTSSQSTSATVDIDWGDGNTQSGVSISYSGTDIPHTYEHPGEYIITVTPTDANRVAGFGAFGSTPSSSYPANPYTSRLLNQNITNISSAIRNLFYASAIQEVDIGDRGRYFGLPRCTNLRRFTYSSANTVNTGGFMFCARIPSFIIPSKQTYIGISSFRACSSLQYVSLPHGLTSIGNYAFADCHALKDIVFPHGLTSIGNYAFNNSGLTTITIPETVTSIGNYAFYSGYGSSTNSTTPAWIKFMSATPPTLGGSAVFGTSLSGDYQINPITIYVPSGSLSAYTSATNYPSNNYFTYVEY